MRRWTRQLIHELYKNTGILLHYRFQRRFRLRQALCVFFAISTVIGLVCMFAYNFFAGVVVVFLSLTFWDKVQITKDEKHKFFWREWNAHMHYMMFEDYVNIFKSCKSAHINDEPAIKFTVKWQRYDFKHFAIELGTMDSKFYARIVRLDERIRHNSCSKESFKTYNGYMISIGDKLKIKKRDIIISNHYGEFCTNIDVYIDFDAYCEEIVKALKHWDDKWTGLKPLVPKFGVVKRFPPIKEMPRRLNEVDDLDSVVEMQILDLGRAVKIVVSKMMFGSLSETTIREGNDELVVKFTYFRENEPSFAYLIDEEKNLTIYVIRHSRDVKCLEGTLEVEIPKRVSSKEIIRRIELLFNGLAIELKNVKEPEVEWKTYKF